MRKLFLLSGAIVLLDQATKLAVKGFSIAGFDHEGMQIGQRIPLLGDLLRLNYVENRGMAFGIDLGVPFLLGLFSIGAAIFLVYLIRRDRDHGMMPFHLALTIILGGAIGNLIDRVFYAPLYGYGSLFEGRVVDFLDLDLPDVTLLGTTITRFGYIFNIADTAVTVGIILLLLTYPKYQRMVEERERRRLDETLSGEEPAHRDDEPTLTEPRSLAVDLPPDARAMSSGITDHDVPMSTPEREDRSDGTDQPSGST